MTQSLARCLGLHSGPVTAGVLRGERARFQLFGDVSQPTEKMMLWSCPLLVFLPIMPSLGDKDGQYGYVLACCHVHRKTTRSHLLSVHPASRMESTGVRGKIQVTESTAQHLRDAGKEQWLQEREDMVKVSTGRFGFIGGFSGAYVLLFSQFLQAKGKGVLKVCC
jgi:Adenylate and Guanylate cyclase catalytic domain